MPRRSTSRWRCRWSSRPWARPTGSAAYVHTQTYLGYWDPTAATHYFDENDTSSEAGQYFRRTGTVEPDGYCNVGIPPPAIQRKSAELRGDLVHRPAAVCLDRGQPGGGYSQQHRAGPRLPGRRLPVPSPGVRGCWPKKQLAASLVGKVTPQFHQPSGTGNYTGIVYFNSCDDRLYVGNSTAGGDCDNPGNAEHLWASGPEPLGRVYDPGDLPSTHRHSSTTLTWPPAPPIGTGPNPRPTQTFAPSGTDAVGWGAGPATMIVVPTPRNLSVVTGTAPTPRRTRRSPSRRVLVPTWRHFDGRAQTEAMARPGYT